MEEQSPGSYLFCAIPGDHYGIKIDRCHSILIRFRDRWRTCMLLDLRGNRTHPSIFRVIQIDSVSVPACSECRYCSYLPSITIGNIEYWNLTRKLPWEAWFVFSKPIKFQPPPDGTDRLGCRCGSGSKLLIFANCRLCWMNIQISKDTSITFIYHWLEWHMLSWLTWFVVMIMFKEQLNQVAIIYTHPDLHHRQSGITNSKIFWRSYKKCILLHNRKSNNLLKLTLVQDKSSDCCKFISVQSDFFFKSYSSDEDITLDSPSLFVLAVVTELCVNKDMCVLFGNQYGINILMKSKRDDWPRIFNLDLIIVKRDAIYPSKSTATWAYYVNSSSFDDAWSRSEASLVTITWYYGITDDICYNRRRS